MTERNFVEGMLKIGIPSQWCEGCLVGKQTRSPYPSHTIYRAKKRLELIHGDLCGPVSPRTPIGNRYFMLLVYNFSRVTWVYLLKTKDKAFQTFKNFRMKVAVETSEMIKVFRTGRGGEFHSKNFTMYCNETSLERHYTLSYSPLQNGIVERRNRTVLEMVRSNLKAMSIPAVLWGEAVNHAVYVLNRVCTKALKESTLYKMWTGRKPNVSHLRVFGCLAHMMIAKNHLKKLDERSKRVVHLGIEKGSKSYELLDPDTGKVYVSRNVVFEEDKTWMWEKRTKIKTMPGMSFTVKGFDFDDEFYDEDGEWVPDTPDQENGSPQNNNDWDESPQSNILLSDPSPHSTPLNMPLGTPNSSVNSNFTSLEKTPSTTSSSTGGSAPKHFRLLADLYENIEEI